MKGIQIAGYLSGVLFCSAALAETMFSFEESTAGWEHESATPIALQVNTSRAHSGVSSLESAPFHFTGRTQTLQLRALMTVRKDFSTVAGFEGFSAWVYIPKGPPHWEAVMFTRSGEHWDWATGERLKNLAPGWHRVQILRPQIKDPTNIQDLGVQVVNFMDDMEAAICLDQVEMIESSGQPAQP